MREFLTDSVYILNEILKKISARSTGYEDQKRYKKKSEERKTGVK